MEEENPTRTNELEELLTRFEQVRNDELSRLDSEEMPIAGTTQSGDTQIPDAEAVHSPDPKATSPNPDKRQNPN
jgi:hypothetical protein